MCRLTLRSQAPYSVADPHPVFHFDADPDPTFYSDVDPDSTFEFDPDPGPTTHFFPDLDPPMLQNVPLGLQPFLFDADPDPDPDFHFDADPEPAFHFDFYPDPQHCFKGKYGTGQQMTFMFFYSTFTLGAINDDCDCAG